MYNPVTFQTAVLCWVSVVSAVQVSSPEAETWPPSTLQLSQSEALLIFKAPRVTVYTFSKPENLPCVGPLGSDLFSSTCSLGSGEGLEPNPVSVCM